MDQTGITLFHKMDGHTRGECVHYSTHCILGDTVKRVCKSSSGYKNMDVPVPTAVKDYNHFMGELTFQTS